MDAEFKIKGYTISRENKSYYLSNNGSKPIYCGGIKTALKILQRLNIIQNFIK